MEILRAEHLTKIYGKGNTSVTAVNDLSLSVAQGEFVAVVGSSGSGKSTLLHMLGGVDQPTEGKVWIQGGDIYTLGTEKLAIFRRRQIGLIYQFFNLIPTLNVEENITLPCELDGQTVDKKRLDKLIDELGLNGRKTHLPEELSGGQQQRVSIGRARSTVRQLFWQMNQPEIWIKRTVTRSLSCCAERIRNTDRPSS